MCTACGSRHTQEAETAHSRRTALETMRESGGGRVVEDVCDDADEDDVKTLETFRGNEQRYASYLKSALDAGMKVTCTKDVRGWTTESVIVAKGTVGEFVEFNEGDLPCCVAWPAIGEYWVDWSQVQIGSAAADVEVRGSCHH